MLGAVSTAANPVFVRLSDVELVASAFHRMAWAIPVMWIWAWTVRRRSRLPAHAYSRRDRILLVLCGALFAADLAALHLSISMTHAANSILFLNAQPIYVVFGAWLLFGTVVSIQFVAAAAVAMTGAVLLAWQSASFGTEHVFGDGLAVVAGFCYAGYILAAGRLRTGRSSAEINLWTCLIGAPILLLTAVMLGQDIVPDTPRDWSLMIALGVVSQALGQGLIVWGLAHLASSFASVALLTAPIAAAVFARVILHETLTGVQILSMLVVLAGIYGAWRASLPIVDATAPPPGEMPTRRGS